MWEFFANFICFRATVSVIVLYIIECGLGQQIPGVNWIIGTLSKMQL